MPLPYSVLFLSSLFTSTLMALSASHWLLLWMSLELNMMSFIVVMHQDQKTQTTEAMVKYFVIQAAGSILFLTAGVSSQAMTQIQPLAPMTIMLSIFMKMGAAPFHFWFPPVASALNWNSLLILSTWQKLAPLGILTTIMKWATPFMPIMVATTSVLIGGFGGVGQTQLRAIIAFSSIGHLGWMIALAYINPLAMLMYFIFYSLLVSPLLLTLKNIGAYSTSNNKMFGSSKEFILVAALLLSLGGVPPLSGFVLKWLSIQLLIKFITPTILIMFILGALMNLYFYLNILFSIMNITPSTLKAPKLLKTMTTSSHAIVSLFFMDLLMVII